MNRIKYFVAISVFFLNFISAAVGSSNENGFVITGKIKDLKNGNKVSLILHVSSSLSRNANEEKWLVLDSCVVQNESFIMRGSVSEGPMEVRMIFSEKGIDLSVGEIFTYLIDNGDHIKLVGYYKHGILLSQSIQIEGSSAAYDYMAIKSAFDITIQTVGDICSSSMYVRGETKAVTLMDKIEDSLGYKKSLMDQSERAKMICLQALESILKSNIHNKAIPALYEKYRSSWTGYSVLGRDRFWPSIYQQLDSAIRVSYYGKRMLRGMKLCIGQTAPDFNSTTPEGISLSLDTVAKKNELTLVDFWASWCFGCFTQLRTSILPLYEKFHDQHFEIIGVSLDDNMSNWRKSIEKNGFKWYNVSSLKGKDEPVYILYQNDYIPHNVLIDKKGEIIAWDVHGIELEWYLDRYLSK